MLIRTKREAVCQDPRCGAELPAGSLVRYYGLGRVYGTLCHGKKTVSNKTGPREVPVLRLQD